MDSKLQEKLERVSFLESQGYSEDIIEALEDFIENEDNIEWHTFHSIEEMNAYLEEEDEDERPETDD